MAAPGYLYLFSCLFLPGFKLRKRRIVNEPTGGTGSCPHLVEAIPCDEPSCYDWLLVKLDECIPDNERECGPGTQIPQVQCVNGDGKRERERENERERDG
jgi:hypothetical protein